MRSQIFGTGSASRIAIPLYFVFAGSRSRWADKLSKGINEYLRKKKRKKKKKKKKKKNEIRNEIRINDKNTGNF